MPARQGIDFETYSDVDLKKHSLDRYINGRDFTPLMLSIAYPDRKPVTFDFIMGGRQSMAAARHELESIVGWGGTLVAHNKGFEDAVLRKMGYKDSVLNALLDSAVIARCEGGAGKLEAAAPQLTDKEKLETGEQLIKVFSIPNEWNAHKPPTAGRIMGSANHAAWWEDFKRYCEADADGGLAIAERYWLYQRTTEERGYELLTAEMNRNGWFVDLPLVREMQAAYQANTQNLVEAFRADFAVNEKFFGSPKQQQEWCAERGVKVTSLDADHVQRLIDALTKKIPTLDLLDVKRLRYEEVLRFAQVKKELGGSSLKKLQVILDTVSADGRLRHQYMHAGAGQTFRTSARGAQLQNLKRLSSNPLDFDDDPDLEIDDLDNTTMAENLRQVFVAEDPEGEEIVGDFSSVESRALAWIAGEQYKIDAYRAGKDIYKVLAAKFQNIKYEDVTKEQRAEGKYSELSCGYQSGPQVLKDFMHNLGFEVSLEGATDRVHAWRAANPNIVKLWATLQSGLDEILRQSALSFIDVPVANELVVRFERIETPKSLTAQHAGAQSLAVHLLSNRDGSTILTRTFHGCYTRGKQICFYKPSSRKSGDLWKDFYLHPKTKRRTYYSIYGGKLAGILTQSLCRELFFYSLADLSAVFKDYANIMLIGQFHDEIVAEWTPQERYASGAKTLSLETARQLMYESMTLVPLAMKGFPLDADIKSAHRYIK